MFLTERNSSKENSINIASNAETKIGRLLSNFADSPFELDGKKYSSVESFWQSLYFPEHSTERDEIAQMRGKDAKKAGITKPKETEYIHYLGKQITIGSHQHHLLMKKAIKAKLEQNPTILHALLKTKNAEFTHLIYTDEGILDEDSKTIPREVFCRIILELREELKIKNH